MKPDAFMVFESCDDYEQALGLEFGKDVPFSAGLLTWRTEDVPAAVFQSRREARRAIDRTEFFRKALLLSHVPDAAIASAMPEAKQCKIVPVVAVKPVGAVEGEA
jgi:hypothetical protein